MSVAEPSKVGALLKEMGSTDCRWQPEPYDQALYEFRHGPTLRSRALACVKLNSVARRTPSAHCVNEHGRLLWTGDFAKELGVPDQTARNVLHGLAAEGLIELDPAKKRIKDCASVPLAHAHLRRTDGESSNSVQNSLPAYVVDFIQSLPEEKRRLATDRYERLMRWKKDATAEAMAKLRSEFEQVEDTMWRELGLEKKRKKSGAWQRLSMCN